MFIVIFTVIIIVIINSYYYCYYGNNIHNNSIAPLPAFMYMVYTLDRVNVFSPPTLCWFVIPVPYYRTPWNVRVVTGATVLRYYLTPQNVCA